MAKGFLKLALSAGKIRPPVVNVDGHPAYAPAITELKQEGELGRNCQCRQSPYLNNIIEQDHRFAKKRVATSQGFLGGRRTELHRGIRGHEHHSQRSDPLVGERRCRRTDAFHRPDFRHRRLRRCATQAHDASQAWLRYPFATQPLRESTKQTNKRIAEQIESARKTQPAKIEVGIRDKKPVPTFADFIKRDFLPHVEANLADKPSTLAY